MEPVIKKIKWYRGEYWSWQSKYRKKLTDSSNLLRDSIKVENVFLWLLFLEKIEKGKILGEYNFKEAMEISTGLCLLGLKPIKSGLIRNRLFKNVIFYLFFFFFLPWDICVFATNKCFCYFNLIREVVEKRGCLERKGHDPDIYVLIRLSSPNLLRFKQLERAGDITPRIAISWAYKVYI